MGLEYCKKLCIAPSIPHSGGSPRYIVDFPPEWGARGASARFLAVNIDSFRNNNCAMVFDWPKPFGQKAMTIASLIASIEAMGLFKKLVKAFFRPAFAAVGQSADIFELKKPHRPPADIFIVVFVFGVGHIEIDQLHTAFV